MTVSATGDIHWIPAVPVVHAEGVDNWDVENDGVGQLQRGEVK